MATTAKPVNSPSQKMVASMKGLLRSATSEFKENSASLKEDMKDILEAARLRRRVGKTREGKTAKFIDHSYNPDAGSEILTHYKREWSDIHLASQEASAALTDSEAQLQEVHKSISQSHTVLSRCHDEFNLLPEVVKAVDVARERVSEVGQLLKQLEESIAEYSRVSAQLECERRQHSLRIQHERYKQLKEEEIQSLKSSIVAEQQHIAEQEHEIEARSVRERQQAFQDMFDQQMKEYRAKGEVERPIGRERSSSQLEDVLIEDESSVTSLQEFLSDVTLDESEAGKASPDSERSGGDNVQVEDEPVVEAGIRGKEDLEEEEEKEEEEEGDKEGARELAEVDSEGEMFEDAED